MTWLGDKPSVEPVDGRRNDTPRVDRRRVVAERGLSKPLTNLRLRWRWLAGAYLLGTLLGGLSSGPTGYEATAVMELTETFTDSQRTKQVGQTVESTATTTVVIAEAADRVDVNTADLASRISVAWVEDTDIVEIKVTATEAASAVREANAMAEAITTVAQQQASDQVRLIRRAGDDLLSSGELGDREAESARRSQLGVSIGSQQNDAAGSSTAVLLVGPAVEGTATGIPRPVGAVLGAFALTAIAAAVAVLLPFRRRRVRDESELEAIMPGVRVRTASSAAGELAGLLVETGRRDLTLVAMDDPAEASRFGAEVAEVLSVHGVPALMGTASELHHRQRSVVAASFNGLREPDAPVLITITPSDERSLNLLAGQSRVLAVVLAKVGQHRAEEIQRVTMRLQYADPTVILTP